MKAETMRKILVIVVAVQFVIAVTSIGVAIYLLVNPVIAGPPFVYDDAVVTPKESLLCPGDMLRWRLQATVTRAPAIVEVVRMFWSVDTQRSVMPQPALTYTIITEPTRFDLAAAVPVPEAPPGRYEYRLAAQESASGAQVQRIPFTIKGGCP